jgi:hypothetical protein
MDNAKRVSEKIQAGEKMIITGTGLIGVELVIALNKKEKNFIVRKSTLFLPSIWIGI